MNKISSYLKLGFEFFQKYYIEYCKALIIPFAFALVGVLFVILTLLNPIFGFFAIIISIPCICCAFWKGYITTYALNFAAYDFYKKTGEKELKYYIEKVDKNELAKYLGFCAIITLICYLPAFIGASKTVDILNIFLNPLSLASGIQSVIGIFILNSLVLIPFLNFYNQALFFKNSQESYLNLFLNCFKLIDKDGLILATIFTLFGIFISQLNPFIYGIVAILLNLITFSVNTFWYSEKCQK